jgi:exosortase F-associated protein
MKSDQTFRWILGVGATFGLVAVFLLQRYDVASWLGASGKTPLFIINRSIRFLVNDALAIVLIYSIFKERKYVMFSIVVQLFGMVFILIPYFIIKVNYPSYNGPLISFLHRLVLNPTLLLILIPAFFFQKRGTG